LLGSAKRDFCLRNSQSSFDPHCTIIVRHIMNLKCCFFLIISVLLTLAFTCSFAQELPPDMQRIIDRKEIIVAMIDIDQPPLFMVGKDGRFYGAEVELAQGIARYLGVEVQFSREAKTFNEVIDIVARKEADIGVSYLSITPGRAKKLLFTKPYLVLRMGLMINRLTMAQQRKEQDPIEFIRNIQGNIAVLAGSSHIEFAKLMFPKATIKEYERWANMVAAVERGDVLAAFNDELEIKKAMLEKTELAIKVKTVFFNDFKDAICMVVPWDSQHLLFWLNYYLQFRKISIDVDDLLKKYPEILSPSNVEQH